MTTKDFTVNPSDFTEEEFLKAFGPMQLLPEEFQGNWKLIVDGYEIKVRRFAVITSPGGKYGAVGYGLVKAQTANKQYDGCGIREHGGGGVLGVLYSKVMGQNGTMQLILAEVTLERERMTESPVVSIGDKTFVVPRLETAPPRGFLDEEKTSKQLAFAMEMGEVGMRTEDAAKLALTPLGSWNTNSAWYITRGKNEGLTFFAAEIDPQFLQERVNTPGVWVWNPNMIHLDTEHQIDDRIQKATFVDCDTFIKASRDMTTPAAVSLIQQHLVEAGEATSFSLK
jgi:hypothetical protein